MAIHVIEVKNPFERKIDNQYYQTYVGGPVTDYVAHADYERVFAVNGIPVDETYIPDDGDEILVAPKVGKKAFKWILPVALVLVGAGLGAGLIGGQMLVGWRIGLALAATMIGNHMIEKMTKPAVDLTNTEQSNTYGWGAPTTLTGQGYVLPVLYGTVKTAGLMLQRHVVSDGDKQYLTILYCLAQGPIDSIDNIKLNGNPISNYQGCEVDTRMGMNVQTVMPNFNDSYADTGLAYELNNDSVWHTFQCDGNDAQGLEITLSFPQGLYHSNDRGNPDWTGVTIEAQYRKVGDTDWTKIPIWCENWQWEPPSGLVYHKRDWFRGAFGVESWWRYHWREDCGTFAGYEVDYTYTRHGKIHTVYTRDEDGNRIEKWTYSMSLADYKKKILDSHAGDGVIKQNKTEAFYRVYDVYGLEPAQYEVRVRCTHKDDTSTRTANKIQWVGVTQVILDDFAYPGKALLGLKALATDQLSGSDPQLTCTITRNFVWVWNPDTKAYEQKPAMNPAWAAYDIIHQCRRLTTIDGKERFIVNGVPSENIDYDAFNAWANMCDANKIGFNYIYDSAMKLYDALQYPCRVGYGAIVLVGTKVSCIFDSASEPVQLFTVANIKKDSFGNEYQSTDDRANCIEISFINKDKDYERDVLAVYSDNYNNSDIPQQPTQVELMGCTDVEQAYRYGQYKLRSNKYEIRTVSFEAFADAIACQIGDVILVQEDVTSWGIGGRIQAVDGNVVTIDRDAASEGSNFTTLLIRENSTDELAYYKVTSVDGDKVTLADTPANTEPGCIYALGFKGHEAKKFRVLSISTGHSDETRTIQAIEYYPELYSMDTSEVPVIGRYDDEVEAPKDLTLSTEIYRSTDGTVTNLIHAAWINPRAVTSVVMETSTDGINWNYEKKFVFGETSYTFSALPLQTHYVRIYAVNDIGIKSKYCTGNIYAKGPDVPPPVTNITLSNRYREQSDGVSRYDIVVQWDKPADWPNYLEGQVWFKTSGDMSENIVVKEGVPAEKMGFNGPWQYAGSGENRVIIPQAVVGDEYEVCVVTKDIWGTTSDRDSAPTKTIVVAAKTTIPNAPDGVSIAFGKTATLSWSEVTNADVAYYEIRTDNNPGAETDKMLARTNALSTSVMPASRQGRIYLFARSAQGKYSEPAVLAYNKPLPKKPNAPVVSPKLGGMAITTEAIPADCLMVNVYIDAGGNGESKSLRSENNLLSYLCGAGVYDVSVTFIDMFGEGPRSDSSACTVKIVVDESMIKDESISLSKVDNNLKQVFNTTIPGMEKNIEQVINTTIPNMQEGITQNADSITALVEDGKGYASAITQNSDSINTLVQDGKGYASSIAQNTDSINTLVQDGKGYASAIAQNSTSITAVVTNLNAKDGYKNYTALSQLDDAINLRVEKNDVINQINMTSETTTIDGKHLHVTGNTLFDKDVIVSGMIQAGAVTADKLAAESITADKIATKTITADRLDIENLSAITANVGELTGGKLTGTSIIGGSFANSDGTFSIDKDGNIKGAKITGSSLELTTSDLKAAGLKISAMAMVKGDAKDGSTLPTPTGYSIGECYAIYNLNSEGYGTITETVNNIKYYYDYEGCKYSVDRNTFKVSISQKWVARGGYPNSLGPTIWTGGENLSLSYCVIGFKGM